MARSVKRSLNDVGASISDVLDTEHIRVTVTRHKKWMALSIGLGLLGAFATHELAGTWEAFVVGPAVALTSMWVRGKVTTRVKTITRDRRISGDQ
jgi:hypothetical protein